MSSITAPKEKSHWIQTYFVPEDSHVVRSAILSANQYSQIDHWYEGRFIATIRAIAAVGASILNTAAYFARGSLRYITHIIDGKWDCATRECQTDWIAALQSAAFAVLGMTFVIAGLVAPKQIFSLWPSESRDHLNVQENAISAASAPLHLVPHDATCVARSLQTAAAMAESKDPVIARVASSIEVTIAVASSFFNIFLYTLRAACHFLIDVIDLRFAQAFVDLGLNVFAALRSVVFVALSVGLVAAGLLFPQPVYSFFAPPVVGDNTCDNQISPCRPT